MFIVMDKFDGIFKVVSYYQPFCINTKQTHIRKTCERKDLYRWLSVVYVTQPHRQFAEWISISFHVKYLNRSETKGQMKGETRKSNEDITTQCTVIETIRFNYNTHAISNEFAQISWKNIGIYNDFIAKTVICFRKKYTEIIQQWIECINSSLNKINSNEITPKLARKTRITSIQRNQQKLRLLFLFFCSSHFAQLDRMCLCYWLHSLTVAVVALFSAWARKRSLHAQTNQTSKACLPHLGLERSVFSKNIDMYVHV